MSHAQHHPLEDDERTFEEDTHVKLRDAFAEFDPKPVASASLAQVYRARLRDGRAVAVKIQQRPVARFLAVDLATIEGFYSLLATLIPGLRLGWLAEETRRHMQEELDFIAEAANAKRVSALLSEEFPRDQVLIPDTHPELCGPRVLVMDWVDGVRIDDTHGLARLHADVPALATRLQKVFGAMTFCHGFVHCDPVRGLWEPNSVCTSLC
jgi:aarF domain-containing kinase